MTPTEIREGYIRHATMAQTHRWYQIYENLDTTIENQLDILANDVKLKSGLGEGVGHDAYRLRISQLPKTWKNAHRVTGSSIRIHPDGEIDLDVDLTYLNHGMKTDGSVRSANLTYATQLKLTDSVLPRFTNIEIKQLSEGVAPAFQDAYPENRVLSLAHYWLALIEDPKRNAEPVREILADNFKLNFSSGAITDFDAFEAWLAGPASQVEASTHQISNFSHSKIGPNAYQLKVDFDWQGILPDKKEMIAKSRHSWTVVDDPKERFARIKNIDVDLLAPFKTKS